jgi:hypothetical protein
MACLGIHALNLLLSGSEVSVTLMRWQSRAAWLILFFLLVAELPTRLVLAMTELNPGTTATDCGGTGS